MWLTNLLRNNLAKLNPGLLEKNRYILARLSCSRPFSDIGPSNDNSRNDMEDLFLDKRIRYLLKALTGYDPMKVFPTKSMNNLNSPKYCFMTDEQLKMEIEKADRRAEQMLQMPPVKYSQVYEPRILEKDIALQGFLDTSVKIIFMDATSGFSDNERLIVVREADGTLREATREERHRTNQIFYPVEERQIDLPKMFEEPHLTDMFSRGAYKLLLDNVCLHFEPEDPRYIELCHKTYDHIASTNNFDLLWSTRHYGGMAFYYVFYQKADSLLYHLISAQRVNDANNLLCLYYIVNPRENIPMTEIEPTNKQSFHDSIVEIHRIESSKQVSIEKFINLLKIYIKNDSNSNLKSRLELSLQKFLSEYQKVNKNVAQN